MALYGRSVRGNNIPRNAFNLSYTKVFDFDIGNIIPLLFEEVLPGDIWKVKCNFIVKFPILNFPVFQQFDIVERAFHIENRVLDNSFTDYSSATAPMANSIWTRTGTAAQDPLQYGETPWEHFITGGKDGTDTMAERAIVGSASTYFYKHSLCDYVGIPPMTSLTDAELTKLNIVLRKITMPFNAVYNSFFRDENYMSARGTTDVSIPQITWAKDRYTSGLPDQQRGIEPSITLSTILGDTMPVGMELPDDNGNPVFSQMYKRVASGTNMSNEPIASGAYALSSENIAPQRWYQKLFKRLFPQKSDAPNAGGYLYRDNSIAQASPRVYNNDELDIGHTAPFRTVNGGQKHNEQSWFTASDSPLGSWSSFYANPLEVSNRGVVAQVPQNAMVFTSSDIRLMMQTQKFLEMNERVGWRYSEQLQARFGVRSRDLRLDKPLYLGGNRNPVVISQVTSTATGDSGKDNLGAFRGSGVGVSARNKPFVLRAHEHGWILVLGYVIPKAIYGQRIDPQWFKKTKFDYFTPEFAHLSEQPVKTKELYPFAAITDKQDEPFGYQGIYDEYREKQSMVCGNFREGGSLDDYTCQRSFSSVPTLSSAFLQVPKFRNLFVSESDDDPALYGFVENQVTVWRKIPRYATPGLVDH